MFQIDPLIFGAVVLTLVGLLVFAPRLFGRPAGLTADDVYLEALPSRYEKTIAVPASAPPAAPPANKVTTPEQPTSTPGAPRATSPVRQPVVNSAPSPAGLAPLKLPAD